jgi:hypothetical protein
MTKKELEHMNTLCAAYAVETNDEKADLLLVEIKAALSKRHREQLAQLVNHGQVWDGDVISKSDRDDLIRWRLASRVMVKGRWGYTAATYLGGHVPDNRIEVFS